MQKFDIGCYKMFSSLYLRIIMRFSEEFKNLAVKYADEKVPLRGKGRPRVLDTAKAAELIFQVTARQTQPLATACLSE